MGTMFGKGKPFSRTRTSQPGEHRLTWPKSDTPLGRSAEGDIHELEEFGVSKKQTRIVKPLGSNPKAAELEYRYLKRTPHLHPKPPISIEGEYFLIMWKMPGFNLGEMIDHLNDGKLEIDAELLIKIALAAGDALQKQVFDAGLLHCDFKPAQLMLDLSDLKNPTINIVDYGSAKDVFDPSDHGGKCTSGYEIPGEPRTEKSDVFALGVSLAKLFCSKMTFLNYKSDNPAVLRIGDRECELELRPALIPYQKDIIAFLQRMVLKETYNRSKMTEALHELHHIRQAIEHPDKSKEKQEALESGFRQAFKMHVMSLFRNPKTLAEIRGLIENPRFLQGNENNPDAVEEYAATSGGANFEGAKAKVILSIG